VSEPFKGTSSTPPAPWLSDKEKCFQEFPEAQGQALALMRPVTGQQVK